MQAPFWGNTLPAEGRKISPKAPRRGGLKEIPEGFTFAKEASPTKKGEGYSLSRLGVTGAGS